MSSRVRVVGSRDNPLLQRLRKLAADPSAYRKHGEFLIEGEHLCSAFSQRGGVARQAVITDDAWQLPELRDLASQAESVAIVPAPLIATISNLESPAALCFVAPWSGPRLLVGAQPSVVLDRVQDAGNVGNILRSAAAFGFTQVIAMTGTAALWSPKVLRAGMGAHFGLRLVESATEALLDTLSMPLLATSSHAALSINEASLPWPCAWIVGHEGQGVSPTLIERCSLTLRIPQPGGEESLNVAAAAAVCCYESSRQSGRARPA